MINVLLMKIIDENPHHDETVTREVRLGQAREALLGEKRVKGRTARLEFEKMYPLFDKLLKYENDKLRRMFLHLQSEETQAASRQKLEEPEQSLRAIAEEHLKEFARPTTDQSSTIDWLRRELAEFDLTAKDMSDLGDLYIGSFPEADSRRDDALDYPKSKILNRVIDDLRHIGLCPKRPPGSKS